MLNEEANASFMGSPTNPDPRIINPLPLIRFRIGILIFRSLKGGGLLIMGLHYSPRYYAPRFPPWLRLLW